MKHTYLLNDVEPLAQLIDIGDVHNDGILGAQEEHIDDIDEVGPQHGQVHHSSVVGNDVREDALEVLHHLVVYRDSHEFLKHYSNNLFK